MGSNKPNYGLRALIVLGGLNISLLIASRWLSSGMVLALQLSLLFFPFHIAAFFLVFRHFEVVRARQHSAASGYWPPHGREPHQPVQDYYLMVLGSGGHTKEMLMMMDDGFCQFDRTHRRYLVSSGDKMSLDHLEDYEADLKQLCENKGTNPGSYDVRFVTRARRVHQSLLTTPITALKSLFDIIYDVLLYPPPGKDNLRYPRIIFSNGPATGFFVGLAVHLLKLIYAIPEDEAYFVYIESWARISTLSLTGKLFHYTGIADALAVQHRQVAKRYNISYAGPMVFNSRRSLDSEPQS